ncbi:MAG: MBL fold metallo-hydrolase [Parvibaculum sp.]|uniref:MBL fold metallo-hydrolase n=1 Tax=Parvibaculum sp. TaxID=2024848 RepID=UPI001B2DC15A|nr:MBL fold metallo-hydrolase [Parvibaculum sp.]MBO6692381.1 MBL fold metallo-hydrolase [Parvibaculum sp.]
MFFQRIETPGIAHFAYSIGGGGAAAIVDPARDVERYLDILRKNGLTLRYVLETHRQEDFEMGGAALRDVTGAEIVACDHELMPHAGRPLKQGDTLGLGGGISFRALHVPGHTPESMCYAVTLDEAPETVWGVFTGDALFMGDTGRTDLIDAEKTGEHAGELYDALHERVFPLGDQALVLPAHGPGSACGGNVADREWSTIGIERSANAAARLGRDGFVRHKLSERMARPPYFRLMEEVNLGGGRQLDARPFDWLSPEEFAARAGEGVVIDTRDVEAFAGGHVPGSVNVWQGGMSIYGGWVACAHDPVWLVAESPEAALDARLALARIGLDRVKGALAGGFPAWRNAGRPVRMLATTSPRELSLRLDANGTAVLDVREESAFAAGHIPGARHVHAGRIEEKLGELGLDRDEPVAVTCSVGHRGGLAASILARAGYTNVSNLLGGMTAWNKLDLPTEKAA